MTAKESKLLSSSSSISANLLENLLLHNVILQPVYLQCWLFLHLGNAKITIPQSVHSQATKTQFIKFCHVGQFIHCSALWASSVLLHVIQCFWKLALKGTLLVISSGQAIPVHPWGWTVGWRCSCQLDPLSPWDVRDTGQGPRGSIHRHLATQSLTTCGNGAELGSSIHFQNHLNRCWQGWQATCIYLSQACLFTPWKSRTQVLN